MSTLPPPSTPQAYSRSSNALGKSPHQLTPEHALASSPLLRDNEYTPMRRNQNRSSVASSTRISRDLEELRQEASGLRQDPTLSDASTPNTQRNSFNPYAESDVEGDGASYRRRNDDGDSGISDKADSILENAKRKLDLLEGNLKGARYSLQTPQQTKIQLEPRAASSASMRLPTRVTVHDSGDAMRGLQNGYSGGRTGPILPVRTDYAHSRGFSETFAPTGGNTALNRSQSLNYPGSRELPVRPLRRPSSEHEPNLGSVIEEENIVEAEEPPETVAAVPKAGHAKSPSITKELRSQADELRSRLAFLQNRARDDSAKRNSHRLSSGSFSEDSGFYEQVQVLEQSLRRQEKVIAQLESAEQTKDSEANDPRAEWHRVLNRPKDPEYSDEADDDLDDDDDDDDDDQDDEDFESVLELPVYDENDDENMSGAHEDRFDAFDYEHFILHSGMGSYGNIVAGSRSSSSSASSASTERGGNVNEAEGESDASGLESWREMQQGNESVASFATARSRGTGTMPYDSASDGNEQELTGGSADNLSHKEASEDSLSNARNNQRGRGSAPIDEDNSTPTGKSFPLLKNPNLHYNRRPASVIFSALISTESPEGWMILSEDDKALLSSLSENLRNAAMHMLQDDQHSSIFWRARLEEARQLLGG